MGQICSWNPANENEDRRTDATVACQTNSLTSASSSRVSRFTDYVERAIEHFRRFGLVPTIHKVTGFVLRRIQPRTAPKPLASHRTLSTPLNLQPGELVEVKSGAEIAATLDSSNTLKGLTFLPAMGAYCGKRFRVHKRMERMFLEESGTVRKLKNTVLLQDVMCDGLLMRCDRSCFFYWREDWLKRVNDELPH